MGNGKERVMDVEPKTIPNTRKEHLGRFPQVPTREGTNTQIPTSEGSTTQAPTNEGSSSQSSVSEAPVITKSSTQSTFNPDLEALNIPKSKTQSTFNPDLDTSKGSVDSNESSTSGITFTEFIEKLFENF